MTQFRTLSPDHPASVVAAKLIPLLMGVDPNASDPTYKAIYEVANPDWTDEVRPGRSPAHTAMNPPAPLFEALIAGDEKGHYVLFDITGPGWRARIKDDDRISVRMRGDAQSFVDWAERAGTLLKFYQR